MSTLPADASFLARVASSRSRAAPTPSESERDSGAGAAFLAIDDASVAQEDCGRIWNALRDHDLEQLEADEFAENLADPGRKLVLLKRDVANVAEVRWERDGR